MLLVRILKAAVGDFDIFDIVSSGSQHALAEFVERPM
jgi:hypothetical protein